MLNFIPNKKATFTTACIFILCSSVLGVNLAVSQPDGIKGCVDKKSGILRIATKCKSTERAIQWSIFGPQGPKGDKGDTGEKGEKGIRGFTVLSGSKAPELDVGIDGDFYIDYSNNKIYGPKRDGVWGSPRDIVGPKGDIGAPGPKGDKGDVGPQGPRGSTGLTGATGATGPSATTKVYTESGVEVGKNLGIYNDVLFLGIGTEVWQVNNNSYIREIDVIFTENTCDASLIGPTHPAFVILGIGDHNFQKPMFPSYFINRLVTTYNNEERSNAVVFRLTPETVIESQGAGKFWRRFSGGVCDITLNGSENFFAIKIEKTNKVVPPELRTDNQNFYLGN